MKTLTFTSLFHRTITTNGSIAIFVLVFLLSTAKAQNLATEIPTDWPKEWQQEVAQMDLNPVKTGLMLNYALLTNKQTNTLRHPFKAKDGSVQTAARAMDWFQLYHQLRAADLRQQRLPADNNGLRRSNTQKKDGATVVPIGILNMEGNLLTAQQISDNKEARKQHKAADGSQYETLSVLLASVLQEEVYQGSVSLQFDPSKHFTNTNTTIQEAGVNFLDGKGFQMVHLGAPQSINYQFTTPGTKVILIKIKTNRGDYVSISQLNIKTVVAYPSGLEFTLQAEKMISTSPAKGGRAAAAITGGTLRAVLGCDGVLDKPVLIVEGFDPGNQNGFNTLIANYLGSYDGTHYTGTFNQLTDSGYDLVFLNFDEARDYIQNNANVVKAAIRKLNEVKSGNGQLIVIGESAGGVTARYALKKLEQEGYSPNVSHYISFDSPHRGAHVPEGVQFLARDAVTRPVIQLINFFSAAAQPLFSIVDDGDQPAARQLIMRRADLQYGITIQPDFTALQNELAQLGYPNQSRNIALVCGSLTGSGQLNNRQIAESQGQRILVTGGNIGFDAIATSAISNQNMELSFLRTGANNLSFSATLPTNPDVVPGGYDRNAEIQDPDNGFRYCFIPTYSSIDSPASINSDNDMYQINANSASPFARIYGGQFNQEHVRVDRLTDVWTNLFGNEFGVFNPSCQAPISAYPPIPSFSAPSTLCDGSLSLSADDASGGIQNLPLEYHWTLELLNNGMGTIVKTGSGQSFGITASDYSPGYYRVTLSDNYQGHSETYGNFAVIAINVNCSYGGRLPAQETPNQNEITVFPNPSDGNLTINLPLSEDENATVMLINSQGVAVYKQAITTNGPQKMRVTNQPSGFYLLRVEAGTRHWTKKVLINR